MEEPVTSLPLRLAHIVFFFKPSHHTAHQPLQHLNPMRGAGTAENALSVKAIGRTSWEMGGTSGWFS